MEKISFIVITAALCIINTVCWASDAYVTDTFRISLRRGPSIENKILKFLPSGQPVEVFETQDGWSRVRPKDSDQSDVEGWVLSRYLISRLPWEKQARSLKEINTLLRRDLSIIEQKFEEVLQKEKTLSSEIKRYSGALDKSRAEYKALKKDASDFLDIKSAYEILRKESQRLKEENDILRNSQRNRWFAMGALILLCGLMIGFLFGRQQKKGRGYY